MNVNEGSGSKTPNESHRSLAKYYTYKVKPTKLKANAGKTRQIQVVT